MDTTPSSPPPSHEAVDYTTPGRPADSHHGRRSLEGLGALLLVLAALPTGLAVNIAFHLTDRYEPGKSDVAGFAVVLGTAAMGALLGWHARQRIRRSDGELYGMTSSTLAMLCGLCILTACTVVMLKSIFPTT